MDWKKFLDVVDKGMRLFSAVGTTLVIIVSGVHVSFYLAPFDETLAQFLFFISVVCPNYLLLSFIDDFLEKILKKDGQNAGSNNAGKS
ncbi:MAG: hypothetical protein LM587_01475 [Candidatus Aenigmarchaeota archaeon]|nr:hypothetical protein [Candidatus Aenigmarchaeota archaeon]